MAKSFKNKSSVGLRTYVSLRVPASGYLSAIFAGTFVSALAIYLDRYAAASAFILISWVLLPTLLMSDRLIFDGKRLYRTGLLPRLLAYLSGSRFWIRPRDVEFVETTIAPSLKRSGRVYFRHRTLIQGKGVRFAFSSAAAGHSAFARELFRTLPEEVLDHESIELRDFAVEVRDLRRKTVNAGLPPSDVLEQSVRRSDHFRRRPEPAGIRTPLDESAARKAVELQLLGNQLRISGSLLQALESFRRAASLGPRDGWLLLDYARCIHAVAEVERDVKLERRAAAMLRLAERRADGDGRLLASVGESYFQLGYLKRAGAAFKRAVGHAGEQFRAIRGLAEVALQDGKLAHVVHNFHAAGKAASSAGARRWSFSEAEYFSRLSGDEDYLEMELGRVNLLDTFDRWQKSCFRLCIAGVAVILLGLSFSDAATTNSGWILAGGMLSLRLLLQAGARMFRPRIRPELLDT